MKGSGNLSKGKKTVVILLCIGIALTLAFIWGNSLPNQTVSSEESSTVHEFIEPVLTEVFGENTVTEELTRKAAHVIEFSALGLELVLLFVTYCNFTAKNQLFILSEGLFVAAFDETIQYFTERGSEITDVCIDFIGFSAVVLIAALIRLAARKARKKKSAKI